MDGCNEGSGDGQPMLYDSVPLASWSIPDLGSGQYDVIDDADVDALAEPRQVAPSRCRRFVDALCGLSGRLKPLTDDDERKAMQAASSRWHLAAHRRTVVVGAFTGVYCIRIQKDNLAASLKFHDLFKQKPISSQDSAAALFHTPSHFVWNEDGTLLACHFAGRCYVYDSSRPLRRLNKILSVPVKGDVVSLCFIRIHDRNETTASSSPIFLCAATRQAIIYSINIGHVSGDGRFHSRRALSVARDGQPSRSSRDPVVHEFSVQHLFDGLSGVAVRDSSSTLYAFGPDSDPSNSDLDPPCNEETQSVSPRMTLKQFDIAQTMAANIDATRLQFRSLDVLGEPPGPMIDNSITPSRRRLAQLLGQSKPGMHMKQVSPLSVLNVVIRMSPCQTAIATLDGYGHVTIWRVRPRPKRVGAIVFKTPAVDISFWSDDLLVVCLGDGDLAIWSIAVRDGDTLELSRDCGIQKFEPRIRVSLSSLSPSGLFALTTLDHYLRPRVAWSEEIPASGTIMRRVSLTLSSIRRVPVEAALAHCLSRQAYDSALELCSRFQICADPVYQRQFASGVVSSDSISSLLCNVKTDQYWVLEQCRTRVATDAAAQKELLEYGLKQTDASSRKPSADSAVRDESAILWAYRLLFLYYLDVLETFTLIQRYDPSEFREFRSTSLRDIAIAAARADRISALQVLLHRHSRVLEPYRLEILSCIPETVPVTSYETLLPSANVSEGAIHSAGAVVASCQARDPDWVEQTSEFLSFVLKSVLTPERTPDDAVPVVDQWKAMLTETGPGVPVNVWLEERALEIDQRSGFTSNAVSLLRYGVEQFPDDVRLRDLLSAAAWFSSFVYDWDGESDNHSRYVLSKFAQEDSNVARIALMLSASSAHSIVQDAVERVWPMFPDRIERRRCMVEFILERLAPQHTPLAVSLLRSESIIENPEDVARSAFGLCRVSDPANFPYISELADIANDELCFQMLRSCEICIKRRHPLPPSVFADNDHDAILSVIRSIILDEVTGISSKLLLPSQRYGGLLKDVYTLAGAERIHEAQEVFLAAIFNHGQLDVARHFSLIFDRSVFERVALREARAQFNRAGPEPSDPAMQSAHAALSLCEDNADVVEERNLHEAVERIRRFGLSSFRPIELRPGEFRVELLRKLIDCFVRRDRRHDSQEFQDIVDICSLVGIRSQDEVSDVLMRAALLANSFNHKDRAAQLATRIMTERHYRAAWKACVDFDDPSLYRHALWACPDSELLNLLDNQCANIAYDAEQHVSMDPMRCALSLVKDRGRSPQVRPDERISSLGDLVPLAAYVADVDDDHRAVQLVQRAVDNPPVDVRISVMIEFAYRCLATISVLKHQRLSVSARDMVTIDNGTLLSMLHGSPADYVTQSALNFHKSMQLCAELCQTVPNEFDGDRMVVDREYAQSAFQRLIQSLDSERIESVMSLSERCQVNLDDLVRSHMRYLFTSVQNKAELEQHVGKWGVLMLGKVKSGTIFDEVDDLVSGTDHVRRSILYRLRSSVDKSASSRLQKHISVCGSAKRTFAWLTKYCLVQILERLQKSDIAVDYKLVLRGGSDAHAALLSAVNDRVGYVARAYLIALCLISLG
ncbi:hypothetical protein PBRA_001198 [Plasmodiophora brassicae]|uniref:Sec39 domain-containing protein n=1 Tax=Plasmodiophora brassicae TaxID=37360 RepID=A0A0G4IVM7_PLABS|nr:hypothetical protein PBRA_001198 [Plasmodiophora brassicae]